MDENGLIYGGEWAHFCYKMGQTMEENGQNGLNLGEKWVIKLWSKMGHSWRMGYTSVKKWIHTG